MSSWKLETNLGPGGAPRFLRDLADVLESGALEAGADAGELAGLPVAELRKLVLVASAQADGFALTLKAKRGHEIRVPSSTSAMPRPGSAVSGNRKAADAAARQREKYRQLKKALQADYKALHKAAAAGHMPGQDLLESFLALSESMVEMPQPAAGAGPEADELARANAAFLEDARALRRAMASRDVAALQEAFARLERRKKACHAQFC